MEESWPRSADSCVRTTLDQGSNFRILQTSTIPSKLIAAQNATVRRARNASAPSLFLDTSAARGSRCGDSSESDRGRECEIVKNLDSLLGMAKGRDAG